MAEPSWQGPLCLVEDKGDAGIQVNTHALDCLTQYEGSFNVVSIIGPAHTGKSYLLNRLAGKHGFRVGRSDPAQLPGLYCWCVPHPNTPGEHLLLLDTQGIPSLTGGNRDQETWILTLATLLAETGTLVFNCLNTLSQDGLDLLHSAIQSAELVRECHSHEAASAIYAHQHHLVWVIRDFYLELSVDGHEITSDEYLERTLTSKQGEGAAVQLSNKVRNSVRDYFATRQCVCIPSPSQDRDILRDLENVPDTQLEGEFVRKIQECCQNILKNFPQKISSQDLCNLLQQYVRVVQSGQISPVQTHTAHALQQVMMAEAASASSGQPMGGESGASQPKRTVEDSWEWVNKRPKISPESEFNQSRQDDPKIKMSQFRDVLENLHKPLTKKIRDCTYYRPGGVEEYREDMATLERSYREQVGDEELAEEVLQKFKGDNESTLLVITQTVEKLSRTSSPVSLDQKKTFTKSLPEDERPRFPGTEKITPWETLEDFNSSGYSTLDKTPKELQDRLESMQKDLNEMKHSQNRPFRKKLTVAFGIGVLFGCGLLYCYIWVITGLSSSGHLHATDFSDYCVAPHQSFSYQNIMENKTPSCGFH